MCRQVGAAQPEPLGSTRVQFNQLQAALEAAPDVVIVTNPTSLHVETAGQAIEAGAHVLIEKPIGHALDGVAGLLELARAKKRIVSVGYNLRFHPGLARLRELLHRGRDRATAHARASKAASSCLAGIRGRTIATATARGATWAAGQCSRSATSSTRCCGCWVDHVRLTALAARASDLEIDTEDVAEIVVQMACGALASVHVDYVRRPPRRMVEIVGDAGVLRWEYDENRLLQYAPTTGAWRVEEGDPRFERNDMYTAELAHFLQAVQEGGAIEPLSTGEEGAAVLSVALAALRSAAEGTSIELTTHEEPTATWLRSFDRPVPSGQ